MKDMRNMVRGFFVLVAIFIAVGDAKAYSNESAERRWAVDMKFNMAMPLTTTDGTSRFFGGAGDMGGSRFSLAAEYYIPDSHFALNCGYDSETIRFYSGDVEVGLDEIALGGRWYLAPYSWTLQPYLGVGAYINVGDRKQDGYMSVSGSENYQRDYSVKCPLFSAAPVIGFDWYVFSCIALEFDYSFRLAANADADILSKDDNGNHVSKVSSRMHRHAFSLGLKVTFPFRLNKKDGNNLMDFILGY